MYQTTEKRASGPKCPVTGKRIQGVRRLFLSSLNKLPLELWIFILIFFSFVFEYWVFCGVIFANFWLVGFGGLHILMLFWTWNFLNIVVKLDFAYVLLDFFVCNQSLNVGLQAAVVLVLFFILIKIMLDFRTGSHIISI